MQSNLRLIIFTLAVLFGLWFFAMSASRYLFNHTDVDHLFSGTIQARYTDIGNRCGAEYENSNDTIEYKMDPQGQIIYLCPQGVWPIQSKVLARTLTPQFKKILNPSQRRKAQTLYPDLQEPGNGTMNNLPATNRNYFVNPSTQQNVPIPSNNRVTTSPSPTDYVPGTNNNTLPTTSLTPSATEPTTVAPIATPLGR